MVQNIPLAIVLQTIGSFCFALAANLQHHAVGQEVEDNHEKQRMSFADLWESVKSPRWLLGLGCMGISLALQVTALVFAPVSVVQPVGLLAFPWSMVLQARAAKHRVPYRIMSAVAATVGATLAFTVIVSLYASPETDLVVSHVFVGAAVVYATALILGTLGSRGPLQWRSLFWASGGAVFYGLEAALVKSLIEFVKYLLGHRGGARRGQRHGRLDGAAGLRDRSRRDRGGVHDHHVARRGRGLRHRGARRGYELHALRRVHDAAVGRLRGRRRGEADPAPSRPRDEPGRPQRLNRTRGVPSAPLS